MLWRVPAGRQRPVLLPTCSVTLGRSFACSELQVLALYGGGAGLSLQRHGQPDIQGPPQLPGLFLPGLWAVPALFLESQPGRVQRAKRSCSATRPMSESGLAPSPASFPVLSRL